MVIRNNIFRWNGAAFGGGVYSENGLLIVEDCLFEDNLGNFGGGVYFSGDASILRNITFRRNNFGHLFFDDGSEGLVVDVVVEDGETTGIFIIGSSPRFIRTTIRNNVVGSGSDGGGMRISSTNGEERATPIFEDCLFEGNTAGGNGGAVYMLGDVSALFIRTTFRDNRAIGGVGGALQVRPEAAFLFCHFERNRAAGDGGAITADGTVNIFNSTFVSNRVTFAPSGGGALGLFFSPLPGQTRTIANTVFVGNKGPHGGAVIAFGAEDTRLVNVTFAGNEGTTAGGAIAAFDSGALEIRNAVFWGNDAPLDSEIHIASGVGPTVERAIVAGGYPSGTDILDQDPLFVRNPDPGPDGTWGTDDDDYGDLRLREGSPGIDYGLESFLPPDIWDLDDDGDTTEPLPIDLNGDVRVQAAEVDLGAYEGAVIVANEPDAPEPSERSLQVYPNPANGFLTIDTDAEEITIVDVLGRVVIRTKATDRTDVSALSPGAYAVRAGQRTALVTIQH